MPPKKSKKVVTHTTQASSNPSAQHDGSRSSGSVVLPGDTRARLVGGLSAYYHSQLDPVAGHYAQIPDESRYPSAGLYGRDIVNPSIGGDGTFNGCAGVFIGSGYRTYCNLTVHATTGVITYATGFATLGRNGSAYWERPVSVGAQIELISVSEASRTRVVLKVVPIPPMALSAVTATTTGIASIQTNWSRDHENVGGQIFHLSRGKPVQLAGTALDSRASDFLPAYQVERDASARTGYFLVRVWSSTWR